MSEKEAHRQLSEILADAIRSTRGDIAESMMIVFHRVIEIDHPVMWRALQAQLIASFKERLS